MKIGVPAAPIVRDIADDIIYHIDAFAGVLSLGRSFVFSKMKISVFLFIVCRRIDSISINFSKILHFFTQIARFLLIFFALGAKM